MKAFGAWNYYQKQHEQNAFAAPEDEFAKRPLLATAQKPEVRHEAPFRCDGRQHCSQMTSRAEAEFFLRNCPDTKMDGDHDGIPCENDARF